MRIKFVALSLFALTGVSRGIQNSYSIKVIVTGLRSDKGKLYLSLYTRGKGYPNHPNMACRLAFSDIRDGKSTILLTPIPHDTYAIACFHDENGNGKLDVNFLGIPKEGVGASNNAKGFLGPPKFDDAKFELVSDTSLTVKINY